MTAARATGAGIVRLPLASITPGDNDRTAFDADGLEALAQSITEHGLLSPVVVRPLGADRFQLVAGERRWRAAQLAGWSEIPAIVRDDLDDDGASALMLAENMVRANLDPIDEATAYRKRLCEGRSVADVARVAGVSATRVSDRVRLLELGETAQHLVKRGQLPLGYASAMVGLDGNRQAIALHLLAGGTRPDLETFRARCDAMRAEQGAESMFDAAAFELDVETFSLGRLDKRPPDHDAPVGETEIAGRLGVKAGTVHQWRKRGLLPAPRWTVSGLPCWHWPTVEAWAVATGRMQLAIGGSG